MSEPHRPRIAVIYASVHGHTATIAARLADAAREAGAQVELVAIGAAEAMVIRRYDGLILAGPVEWNRHPRALERFAAMHAIALATTPSAFVSVSMAAAGDREFAKTYVDDFAQRTGWTPSEFATIPGAELFTKYGFLTRWLMRRIARKHGREGNVRRDYEYTDWEEVHRFGRAFVMRLLRPAAGESTG